MWYYPGEKRSKEFNADTMLLKEEYEAAAAAAYGERRNEVYGRNKEC